MSKQLQPLSVAAPAFFGLNTQDSPVGMSANFAKQADNCVIDKQGRIAARQGHTQVSTSTGGLGSNPIETIYEFVDYDGTKTVVSAGNNKLFTGTTTLADATPSGYTPTANHWQGATLAGHVYLFQKNHLPLLGHDHAGTGFELETIAGHEHATGTPPSANAVLAAFGRLWAADIVGDTHTVYWSDDIASSDHGGHQWTGGTSGSIDISGVWKADDIVALAEFNGRLVIFGKRQVVMYNGAASPSSTMAFEDIIDIGCIARDSVQQTGDDLIFLSDRGVMSLGRLIQEKSQPLRDISKNVRSDLMADVPSDTAGVKSVYSPENAFYLLSLPAVNKVYVFDLRGALEDGSYRATKWTAIALTAFERLSNGTLYMGKDTLGIVQYGSYQDAGNSYRMNYYSNEQDFGAPSKEKFLKKMRITVIGGALSTAVLKWGYDYEDSYSQETFTFGSDVIGQFGISEFGSQDTTPDPDRVPPSPPDYDFQIAEYNSGVTINRPSVNASGSGTTISFGVEAVINNSNFSIQKIDILALIGRLL